MNRILKRTMLENTPRINKQITDGNADDVLDAMPMYLDDFFRSGLGALSPKINLTYMGYRKMGPKEEYDTMVTRGTGTVPYDLSHSDVYVVEFRFEYNGVIINRPIYLPYAGKGNIMVVGGTNYHITPVLSDTVISPSSDGVFIRLLKAKLNFTAASRYFMVNGDRVAGNVIHGNILSPNLKQITDRIGRPLTSTSLYLLGKYGLVETLKKYGRVNDVYVTTNDVYSDSPDMIVYSSCQNKPRGLKMVPYMPHNVKIVVTGDKMDRAFVDNLVYGVIYTLDILPLLETDMVDLITSKDVATEIKFWRITLGKVIYKNSFSIERIAQDLDEHYEALNGYIDDIINRKLLEVGIKIDNMFDLLALTIGNYNNWVLTSKEYNSNIENRYIDILYYLTCDIIIGFNRVILSLNKRITKTNEISTKEVSKVLSNELGSKRVYRLTKSSEPNLAVSVVDSSSDIRYPKITAILEDQIWSFVVNSRIALS